jgi:hypothetical protein
LESAFAQTMQKMNSIRANYQMKPRMGKTARIHSKEELLKGACEIADSKRSKFDEIIE